MKENQNATMTMEALEARRAYQRKWGRENKEKRREYNRAYWERKAARLAEEQAKGSGDNGGE